MTDLVMSEKSTKIRELCTSYNLTIDQLKKFQKSFLTEIKNGLCKSTHDSADVKCHITYVTSLPDGTERGKYLALDLGGSNFRVLLVDLIDDIKFEMQSKIYKIPHNIMAASGEKLFDLIVESLEDFIDTYNLKGVQLSMGFTFAFPVKLQSLTNGSLVKWTKGFSCSGVVDKNIIDLLRAALKKKPNIKIEIIALLSDTTGTLMSCAFDNRNCRIGLIVGTGMNVCYWERVLEVENWDPSKSTANHVIINTECGAFGENGCIDFLRTEEDKIVDMNSINKGQQYLEKMTSSMYLGEIARLIMLKMTKEKLLFDGNESDVLNTYDAFRTSYISEIESDPTGKYPNCRRILKEFRLDTHATDEDCENILYICKSVAKRSAHLVSATIATLITRINEKSISIGVDGSVYRLHPHYHKLMVEKIRQLIPPDLQFELLLSDDGSGKGAAIIAAVASKKSN